MRSEVFTAMKIQIEAFWVVTPCDDVVGYQHFRGPRCLHLEHYTASQPLRSQLERFDCIGNVILIK
jgi:hypothetical protein